MKRVLLFPGSGSQHVGMFEPYLKYDWAQNILHRANSALDFDLTKIVQEDPENQLDQIPYASPAIL